MKKNKAIFKSFFLKILFSVVLVLSSCDHKNDLLLGFEFNSSENEWKNHLKKLLKKGILIQKENSGVYSYYLQNGNDSIELIYKINVPFPKGISSNFGDSAYINNPLRIIEINLSSENDESELTGGYHGYGVNSAEVDFVRNHLKSIYGSRKKNTAIKRRRRSNPFTSLLKNNLFNDRKNSFIYNPDAHLDRLNNYFRELDYLKMMGYATRQSITSFDGFLLNGKRDEWYGKDYDIEMIIGELGFRNLKNDSVYNDMSLIFRKKDYYNDQKELLEKIRSNLKAHELIKLELDGIIIPTINFYDEKRDFNYIHQIKRFKKRDEEIKRVSDISFGIKYYNRFNELICEVTDINYTFDQMIIPDRITLFFRKQYISIQLDHLENAGLINNLKKYADDFRVKEENTKLKGRIEAVVTKVRFEDGSVVLDNN